MFLQLRTDFWIFCWDIESRTVFPVQFSLCNIITRFCISRDLNLFLRENLAMLLLHPSCFCWCLLPALPLAPNFLDAELQQRFLVVCSTKNTSGSIKGLVISDCFDISQCNAVSDLFYKHVLLSLSLLQHSKRSVNILRTQEVPDKYFLARCFHKREYSLIYYFTGFNFSFWLDWVVILVFIVEWN